jgi:hypothetical protein
MPRDIREKQQAQREKCHGAEPGKSVAEPETVISAYSPDEHDAIRHKKKTGPHRQSNDGIFRAADGVSADLLCSPQGSVKSPVRIAQTI